MSARKRRSDLLAEVTLRGDVKKAKPASKKVSVSDYVKACLARCAEADDVAKELRALAEVFRDVGPGHAAVLRHLAHRLDGADP